MSPKLYPWWMRVVGDGLPVHPDLRIDVRNRHQAQSVTRPFACNLPVGQWGQVEVWYLSRKIGYWEWQAGKKAPVWVQVQA